jgi:predicted secreted protein
MAITSGAFVGRDFVVEVAYADEAATIASLSYTVLGFMRGKKLDIEWQKVDTTADSSPGQTMTALATYKGVKFDGDGRTEVAASANQKTLQAYAFNPGAAMQYQPKLWFRLTDPDGSVYEGPFLLTKFGNGRDYKTEATWSISAESNGEVTYVAA